MAFLVFGHSFKKGLRLKMRVIQQKHPKEYEKKINRLLYSS